MTTRHKVEVKPWQPKMEREPEFNPFANPRDRELENPPLEESTSEDGESAQNTGGAADAERWRRFKASV